MRERVQAEASRLRLRGALGHALGAVLKLLCDWSRVTDDRVGLNQIVELIEAGAGRRYDLKTIGRALAGLSAADLIVYRAAQGRGKKAFVGIHSRFIGDIEVLERDRDGHVITDYSGRLERDSVTFSPQPSSYINQLNYPPTPRNRSALPDSRPTEVDPRSHDLREVLAGLPEPMKTLPKHLRWMLGREIRQRLQAGWLPHQLLEVLRAPIPCDVHRPWRLALWRLSHNVVGAGPRLRPYQQAWDARARAHSQAAADHTVAHWYGEVAEVTTAAQRADLLAAHEAKFGTPPTDPVAALAGAGRRAARLFPQLPLAAALTRWVADIEGSRAQPKTGEELPQSRPRPTDLLIELAISDAACVVCGSRQATARAELPLKSMVCERCWPMIAAELATDTPRVNGAA